MSETTKVEKNPETPIEAVPVESGGKYILLIRDRMPPPYIRSIEAQLTALLGEGNWVLVHGCDAELYKIEGVD